MHQAGRLELDQEQAAKAELQAQLREQAALIEHLQAEVGALSEQKEQLLADLAQLADAASSVCPAQCSPCSSLLLACCKGTL